MLRRARSVLAATVAWIATAAAGLSAGPPEPLRSIAAILALPVEEYGAGRPVVARGVVTTTTPLVIQDGEDAIYLDPTRLPVDDGRRWQQQLADLPLEVGAEVEVTGFVDPGGYAPRVVLEAIRRLGTRPLPEPVPIDIARLFAGGDVGRRVRATGVVQAVLEAGERWSLVFEAASRRFTVTVGKAVMPERPDELVDAEVEVVGVGNSFRNTRGEFIAPGLYVARAEDLQVLRRPEQGPFELPLTPLGFIARYRSKPLGGHRLRTAGVVAFAAPGTLYLQEGIGGVRVELVGSAKAGEPFRRGDRVEVAGFPDMTSGVGAISWAVAERISGGPPPVPLAIQPSDIIRINDAHELSGEVARPGSYDGCLIRCRGRIEAVRRSAAGIVLTLTERGTAFTATLVDAGGPTAPPFVTGSEVEITGIVQAGRKDPGDGDLVRGSVGLSQLGLLARNAADIRVVRLPPWWTPGRLGVMAALLGGIAAAAIIWVTILRREVARQTARALAEESARAKAAIDYEVTLRERNRLAANLHDTILQTVTGIAFQLKVCQTWKQDGRMAAEPATAGEREADRHLGVARRMVEHAADQLRGTVWSLRSLPTDGRSFSAALEELVERAAAGHSARIGLDVDPGADGVPAYVAGNLLLAVQEALHNALHHAGPAAVEVTVTTRQGGGVAIEIGDDGAGFELGRQAGPRQGHFGLAGMRERVERLGGTLEIDTAPGRGTRVRIEVPAEAFAGLSARGVYE